MVESPSFFAAPGRLLVMSRVSKKWGCLAKFCEVSSRGFWHDDPVNPSTSNDQAWAWHKKTLLRLRDKITRRREAHYASAVKSREAAETESSERASEASEQEVVMAELKNDEAQLAAIEAALARIKAGTYGICVETGKSIARARLRALPWTPLSLEAANQLAAQASETTRAVK